VKSSPSTAASTAKTATRLRHTDPDKRYYKYAGQAFWHFVSGDDDLYREIIAPIDKEARRKDETFKKAYAAKVNEMTQDFTNNFMTPDNQIDWFKLTDYVSKREHSRFKNFYWAGSSNA